MSSGTTDCPICFERFSTSVIGVHASSCTGPKPPSSDTPEKPGKKRFLSPPPSSPSSPSQHKPGKDNAEAIKVIGDEPVKKKAKVSLSSPLADHCRPTRLDDIVGQDDVTGDTSFWKPVLTGQQDVARMPSTILWGPPGCGKTSLANVIAGRCKESSSVRFVRLSACTSGVADVKEVVSKARNEKRSFKRGTVLFIDEIHRFNKSQQDTFLPHIEDGTITLVGATTENPSFSLNKALLSRCKTVVLKPLSPESLVSIVEKAISAYRDTLEQGSELEVTPEAVHFLAKASGGDARTALNCLEMVMNKVVHQAGPNQVRISNIKEGLKKGHLPYDKKGDDHYDCASALQKSIRGCDDSAALYWTVRMLEGGEDPMFIGRRLVRIASEDVGLGDPQALTMAVSAMQGCQLIGRPECDVILAECALYLARAPKSHEVYAAMKAAKDKLYAYEGGAVPAVPLHLRNPTSKLDRERGYGNGYSYNLEEARHLTYLPEGVNFNPFGQK